MRISSAWVLLFVGLYRSCLTTKPDEEQPLDKSAIMPELPTLLAQHGNDQGDNYAQTQLFCNQQNFDEGWWEQTADHDKLVHAGDRDSLEFALEQCPNNCEDKADTKLRFLPKNCQFHRFSASRLLDMLKGRTLMVVGDSLQLHWFQSLQCLIRVALPQTECTTHERMPDSLASELRQSMLNTAPLDWYLEQKMSWEWTDCVLPEGGKLSMRRLNFLPSPEDTGMVEGIMNMLFTGLSPTDLALVNFGPWYGKLASAEMSALNLLDLKNASGVMADSSLSLHSVTPIDPIDNSKKPAASQYWTSLKSMFDGYKHSTTWPKIFWRETAAAHFPGGFFLQEDMGKECQAGNFDQWNNLYQTQHLPIRRLAEESGIWVLSVYMPSTAMFGEHPPIDFDRPLDERRQGWDCRHFCKRSSTLRLWTHTLFNAMLQYEFETNQKRGADIPMNSARQKAVQDDPQNLDAGAVQSDPQNPRSAFLKEPRV